MDTVIMKMVSVKISNEPTNQTFIVDLHNVNLYKHIKIFIPLNLACRIITIYLNEETMKERRLSELQLQNMVKLTKSE